MSFRIEEVKSQNFSAIVDLMTNNICRQASRNAVVGDNTNNGGLLQSCLLIFAF